MHVFFRNQLIDRTSTSALAPQRNPTNHPAARFVKAEIDAMADQQQPPPHSSNSNGSQEPTTQPDSAGQVDSAIKPDPDQDATEDQDIDMAETNAPQGSIPDAENPAATIIPTDVDPIAPAPTPSKKETSLREFLGKMDDYAPIVRSLSLLSFHIYFPLSFH